MSVARYLSAPLSSQVVEIAITHSLIALLSNLLAHELLHPLRGLVVAGVGNYERHGCFDSIVVRFVSI